MWIEHGAEVSNISLRKKCKIEKRILKNPLFLFNSWYFMELYQFRDNLNSFYGY